MNEDLQGKRNTEKETFPVQAAVYPENRSPEEGKCRKILVKCGVSGGDLLLNFCKIRNESQECGENRARYAIKLTGYENRRDKKRENNRKI